MTQIFSFVQLAAAPTPNVPSQKCVLTEIVLMPVLLTTPVLPTPNATPPTTSQPVAVPRDCRVTPTSAVSEWSVASTKTVPRTRPASTTSVPIPVCMRTPAHPQPRAVSRTTWPSARVPQAGLATLWSDAHPSRSQTCRRQSRSVTPTQTAQMTQLASMRGVRTPVMPCHHAT